MSTTITTSALVLREIGKPVIFETLKTAELQPNEALIEIHATGVCQCAH
jgi:D-arabinose 1-dehydrogenase-like Zn-dependent alcohol dehydrogenase